MTDLERAQATIIQLKAEVYDKIKEVATARTSAEMLAADCIKAERALTEAKAASGQAGQQEAVEALLWVRRLIDAELTKRHPFVPKSEARRASLRGLDELVAVEIKRRQLRSAFDEKDEPR